MPGGSDRVAGRHLGVHHWRRPLGLQLSSGVSQREQRETARAFKLSRTSRPPTRAGAACAGRQSPGVGCAGPSAPRIRYRARIKAPERRAGRQSPGSTRREHARRSRKGSSQSLANVTLKLTGAGRARLGLPARIPSGIIIDAREACSLARALAGENKGNLLDFADPNDVAPRARAPDAGAPDVRHQKSVAPAHVRHASGIAQGSMHQRVAPVVSHHERGVASTRAGRVGQDLHRRLTDR